MDQSDGHVISDFSTLQQKHLYNNNFAMKQLKDKICLFVKHLL